MADEVIYPASLSSSETFDGIAALVMNPESLSSSLVFEGTGMSMVFACEALTVKESN